MTAETILYIVIAGIIAFALVLFMYGYRSKYPGKLRWVFGLLRFISLFALFLLLINPKFITDTYIIEKPKLPILIDNSSSLVELNQEENVLRFVEELKTNTDLNDKFDLSFYHF